MIQQERACLTRIEGRLWVIMENWTLVSQVSNSVIVMPPTVLRYPRRREHRPTSSEIAPARTELVNRYIRPKVPSLRSFRVYPPPVQFNVHSHGLGSPCHLFRGYQIFPLPRRSSIAKLMRGAHFRILPT